MNKKFPAQNSLLIFLVFLIFYLFSGCQNIEKNNLAKTYLVITDKDLSSQKYAAQVLVEEVEKRTGFKWEITTEIPESGNKIVLSSKILSESDRLKPESYKIKIEKIRNEYDIHISGSDQRGLLYGIGKFLHMLEWENESVIINSEVDITSSPEYPIRGHQLGYRNRANSWDAWTPDQFEQYIRELVFFGANSIENIPFEDDTQSPHMKLPREEMNLILSQICAKYDLDYWIWTPADFDLNDNSRREESLRKHETLYNACPRLDGVFFPGGDPGHNPAPILFPFLEDLYGLLLPYHPKAKIWLSLQWFGDEDVDYIFNYIETQKPEWLGGLVSGPGGRPVDDTRKRLPANYQLRHYPDITHTVRCQYPVEWWDQAYELTLGREPINPRPEFYSKIHEETAGFTNGFIAYSDGVHDDVNKVVYLEKGWDPERKVEEILKDYTRLFFGSDAAGDAARGILDLENNWKGALISNNGINETLELWNKLEKQHPELKNNWRWQMNLLRANYDAYIRRRLIYEEELERNANLILKRYDELGINNSLDSAYSIINRNAKFPVEQELRLKIEKLCEDLFHSIGLQTSMEKYQASGWERGCILDYVDAPLNNREWLEYKAKEIKQMKSREDQIEEIKKIADWENPGEGSFYDNIGKISQSDQVDKTLSETPGYGWFGKMDGPPRLSTRVYIEQPVMRYENLEPDKNYMIRAAGYGEALLRVNGKKIIPSLYNKGYEEFKEFVIPSELYKGGRIEVTWDKPDESHLNWRYQSFISDVWLLRD